MIGGLTLAIFWLIIVTTILASLCIQVVKLIYHLISLNKQAKQHLLDVKKRTEEKYNKYIALTPAEFDERLIKIFSTQLELCAVSDVSEKDPDATGVLYAHALEGVMRFIGTRSIDAIDYYYGTDYISRWCEVHYRILENRGILSKVITRQIYSDTIARELRSIDK